jgi:hypothetical protein
MPDRKPKADRHRQKTITFRIPADLMEALRKQARRTGRTLSREAGLAIKAHLSQNQPQA